MVEIKNQRFAGLKISRCDIKILFVIFTLKIFIQAQFYSGPELAVQWFGPYGPGDPDSVKWSCKTVRWIGLDLGGMKFILEKKIKI